VFSDTFLTNEDPILETPHLSRLRHMTVHTGMGAMNYEKFHPRVHLKELSPTAWPPGTTRNTEAHPTSVLQRRGASATVTVLADGPAEIDVISPRIT
jgi:hypothetical protein